MPGAVKITFIELKEPCSACLIIGNLLNETLTGICSEYGNVYLERIILENLKDVHKIEGLEVEKFPAVLVNNEQISAGSLIMKEQLIPLIMNEGGDYE